MRFGPPTLDRWLFPLPADAGAAGAGALDQIAVVMAREVPLYASIRGDAVVGYTGVGQRLPARPLGRRCAGGTWAAVSGGAYLCTGDGVELAAAPVSQAVLFRVARRQVPNLTRAVPFRTGKARRPAPVFERVPTLEELAEVAAGHTPAGLALRRLDGTYLLALAHRERARPAGYLELLSGELIRAADVEPFPIPPMHGERLDRGMMLPIAFAWRDAEVFCLVDESVAPCGTAAKHARFPGSVVIHSGGEDLVVLTDRHAVRRAAVRIAERIPRPRAIPPKAQWIHIDLSEQTLVAYDGDEPVYATLVSTGRPGHTTPRGVFQVYRAYLTKEMNGVDEEGPYQVQEVPWTLYFHGNYAMHGAYWHDVFGHTRSHGCVNVPPADARWLFYWSKPHLPRGWTASLRMRGPRVYVSGQTPPDEPEARKEVQDA